MKRLGKYLVLAGLIVSAGCTSDSGAKGSVSAKTQAKVDPAPEMTPVVTKMVPLEQLSPLNANEQADVMYKSLLKDSRDFGRTETAGAGQDPSSRNAQ
jgi:hypothetical protein